MCLLLLEAAHFHVGYNFDVSHFRPSFSLRLSRHLDHIVSIPSSCIHGFKGDANNILGRAIPVTQLITTAVSRQSRSPPPNAKVRLCSRTMTDGSCAKTAVSMAISLLIATTAVLLTEVFVREDPTWISAVQCLSKFFSKLTRVFVKILLLILATVLGEFIFCLIADRYNSPSTDKPEHNEAIASPNADKKQQGVNVQATAHPEKAVYKDLKGSEAQVARWADAHGAQHESLQQRSAELRDSHRIIQSQITALERFEHRADAAERNLRAKTNVVEIQSIFLETKDSKIQDQRDLIALQAQQIKDSNFELEAMAQQIREKDRKLWEIAGSLTVAEQEVTKLKAAVAEEHTASDYCSALDEIHHRDETINGLEKKLAQQANDHEFNRETVNSLATLLVSLGDKEPAEAVHELEAWADEREARFDDFVTLSGPVVIVAQQDLCQRLRNTNDLQHKLLRNSVETRNNQIKVVAELKAQVAALTAREEENIKFNEKMKGEKKHLLDALNNSQTSLQAANMQVQTAVESRVQEVAIMNNKFRMVREALQIIGLDCDLWTIETPEVLASMIQHEEAKLAETCAELSAANDVLQINLNSQATETAALKTDLRNTTARHHKELQDLQGTLGKVTTELKIAKRDSPSRELENKVNALQIRLKVSNDENKVFRSDKYHAEHKVEVLTMAVTNQAQRLKKAREDVESCAKVEKELRSKLESCIQQTAYMNARIEEERDARRGKQEEMKRLAGLLKCREEEVRALEDVKEKLEKKLVLGEGFVDVTGEDVPVAAVEHGEEEEDGLEVNCFADEFEELEADEEAGKEVDCFSDEFEAVNADEDGEGLDALIGAPEFRVQ